MTYPTLYPNYRKKIFKGIDKLAHATLALGDSNVNWIDDIYHDLTIAEDLLLNPFQTVPIGRIIHITISFCDHDGDSHKSHNAEIGFEREISAADIYIFLKECVKDYEDEIIEQAKLHISIQDIEKWLNEQKPLLKTTTQNEPFIEDTGLTVCDMKTEYGSINFFMEYAINHPEETWEPPNNDEIEGHQLTSMDDDTGYDSPRAIDERDPSIKE